jgi:hypothetical protein
MFTPGLSAEDHHLTTEQAIEKFIQMGYKVTFSPDDNGDVCLIKAEPVDRSSLGALIDVTEFNTLSNALTTLLEKV